MNLFRLWISSSLIIALLAGLACTTSPLGRKQLMLVSDAEVSQMGVQAFDQMKQQVPIVNDPAINQYVQCIVGPITQAAASQSSVSQWEVKVFKDETANAFALPGGKIGVHTGILKVAKTPDQLAAVLGHEVGHVIAHHGAERISQEAGTQVGLSALGTVIPNNPNGNLLIGLLGAGAQVGVLLPFSRTQESEADIIGLDLMAEAGFDPHQSVDLWKNMMSASGGKAPPEWLSTHPASENRIAHLSENMSGAVSKFQAAKAQGRHPQCRPPAN